jgi:predicted RNA-binding Zn ribbon-like protein
MQPSPDAVPAEGRPPLLLADHPALDFLNSRATPGGAEVEWIGDGEALVRWLTAAGFVGPEPGTALAGDLAAERADAAATSARSLREWLRGFVAGHAGRALTAAALAELGPLNALLAEDAAYRQLRASGGALAWTNARRRTPEQALLQPLASAIGDLACDADFRRVRHCEGEGCTLWFLDRTKGGKRRWCSMALCGNRAKASAHRSRRREREQATTDGEPEGV